MVTLNLTDCMFDSNRGAKTAGGGIFVDGGGYDRNSSINYLFQHATDDRNLLGLKFLLSEMNDFGTDMNQLPNGIRPSVTVILQNVHFLNNTANNGGGIGIQRGCLLYAKRVTFAGNWAAEGGGAQVIQSLAFFRNCTFFKNNATHTAGGLAVQVYFLAGRHI